MKSLVCGTCGHIEFDAAPEQCLVCGSGADKFIEDPNALKTAADAANPTEAEKKHIPQIVVVKECGLIPDGSCNDVHVRVGEIEHVMTQEHHIRSIDYYLNKEFISRVWLAPEKCHPAAGLHVNATSGTITAIENCNQHGNWVAEAEL